MPRFDWRASGAESLSDEWVLEPWQVLKGRFKTASEARGLRQWSMFVDSVQEFAGRPQTLEWQAEVHSRLATLIQELQKEPVAKDLTVFVSHQRYDAHWAEWVAWAATEAHLDYWLDIHDPALTTVNALVLSPLLKSVLVAGIIEMALLNCTHVVSMQTKNAQASRWVPYEFGRAKDRLSLAVNAASWFENGIAPTGNADYLWLAFSATNSADLKIWLDKAGHKSPPTPNDRWAKGKPGPLPN